MQSTLILMDGIYSHGYNVETKTFRWHRDSHFDALAFCIHLASYASTYWQSREQDKLWYPCVCVFCLFVLLFVCFCHSGKLAILFYFSSLNGLSIVWRPIRMVKWQLIPKSQAITFLITRIKDSNERVLVNVCNIAVIRCDVDDKQERK